VGTLRTQFFPSACARQKKSDTRGCNDGLGGNDTTINYRLVWYFGLDLLSCCIRRFGNVVQSSLKNGESLNQVGGGVQNYANCLIYKKSNSSSKNI
jgi:hypothetical protein